MTAIRALQSSDHPSILERITGLTEWFDAAENHARKIGISEMVTHTFGPSVDYAPSASTRAFYSACGFTVYETARTDNPGCTETIKIRKILP